MLEPKETKEKVKGKILFVDLVHIIFFGGIITLNIIPLYRHFSLQWHDIENIVEFAWNGYFYIPPSHWLGVLYGLDKWLTPSLISSLMILLCFKRNLSKITSHGYMIIAASFFVFQIISSIIIYSTYSNYGPVFSFRNIMSIIAIPIIMAPPFIFGFNNKNPMVIYKDEKLKKWVQVILFPLYVVKMTIKIADDNKHDKFVYNFCMIIGLTIAAHFSTLMYEVFILGTIIPVAIFIIIWLVVLLIVIWIGLKLLTHSADKDTTRTEERTTIFGRKYSVTTDNEGKEISRSEEKEKLFGGKYVEKKDKDGNIIFTSEMKEKFFGGKYTEHKDSQGNVIGTSEEKDKFFGGKVIENKDIEGNVVSTSEKKKDLFGGEYIETKIKEK
jgi:hypothetical protein